jgi:hypothetical protein
VSYSAVPCVGGFPGAAPVCFISILWSLEEMGPVAVGEKAVLLERALPLQALLCPSWVTVDSGGG